MDQRSLDIYFEQSIKGYASVLLVMLFVVLGSVLTSFSCLLYLIYAFANRCRKDLFLYSLFGIEIVDKVDLDKNQMQVERFPNSIQIENTWPFIFIALKLVTYAFPL